LDILSFNPEWSATLLVFIDGERDPDRSGHGLSIDIDQNATELDQLWN
jgi:hypothetical protein